MKTTSLHLARISSFIMNTIRNGRYNNASEVIHRTSYA